MITSTTKSIDLALGQGLYCGQRHQQGARHIVEAPRDRPAGPLTPFYTIGYSRRSIQEFVRSLRLRRVATLIDVRHAPVSQHRPQFSKRNLQRALEEEGIAYVHIPALGVPKPIRDQLAATGDYNSFFTWYDDNVVPHLDENLRDYLEDSNGLPAAFMCVEEDHSQCHRSRIAAALNQKGIRCVEIG